jgi:hydroxymethylglutaryl-CoA synthase
MYCGSVYGSLCSLISNISSADLQGKRIGMFSYGSGLASSMFSFKVNGSTEEIAKELDIQARLDSRRTVAPEVYDEVSSFDAVAIILWVT